MSTKPKILLVGKTADENDPLVSHFQETHDVVFVANPLEALAQWGRQRFDAAYIASAYLQDTINLAKLLQNEQIIEGMPDGIVLIDSTNTILWSNTRLKEWTQQADVAGKNFYSVMGGPEILGPDFCPFHTALATNQSTCSTLRSDEGRYFQVHAAPLHEGNARATHLIVTMRDVTEEIHQQQKLAAIHQAGMDLADLTPNELFQMTVEERIELLKANILHYTRDLLHFDVVEIRLLDPKTNRLDALLCEGLAPEAVARELYAQPQHNGVTGFVAATAKSYLCEDTTEDPLYLEGARGAKSSLTVPLVLHDEVIGTFNVESPEPRAFSESDLQFLEIFGRDVAVALNTLELLAAEKVSATTESVEAIHSAVALPVDEILNDAVHVMERYIGHDAEVVERLQRILRNARDIKQVIQKVGQKMAPAQAYPQAPQVEERLLLKEKRLLVVDEDENVRTAAHNLLERYGCQVETARDGAEALCMVRMFEGQYDVIISAIDLPDMNGYDLLLKLKEIVDPVPMVLMTGFGYDPKHTIVKARQAGLKAVLYKPFRLDQLLTTVEGIIQSVPAVEPCEK